MKKSIPKLDELVNRYVKAISKKENQEISLAGKSFLKQQWIGKEEQLYKLVKKFENKLVKSANLNERIEVRTCKLQYGGGLFGEPLYVVHENIFQHNLDHKKNITATRIVDQVQYEYK